MELQRCLAVLVLLYCAASSTSSASVDDVPKFQLVEEWKLWKSQHGKSYDSTKEELEKHITWLSNKEYIDQHNANSDVFGFTLAMNHLGDMVSQLVPLKDR